MVWLPAAALFFFQAANYSADGLKALDAEKYDAAVQDFTQAIAADPKDYAAHFNLGLAYTFLQKDTEAIAEYRKALELKPRLYEAELNAGILLLKQKNPADALALLTDAAAQRPSVFRPRYYLAEAQFQTGDDAQAEASYRAAADLDPKSAAAQLGLGRTLARQGKLDQAAPYFRQAAALDPKFRDSLLELAGLYEKNHQRDEAIAIYRQFPENAAAQEHVGELLLETKKYDDAIPQLEQAYQASPTEANRVALAVAYVFTNKLDKASPLLSQAVQAEPANYDVRMMYARALRDQRQFQPAAAQFYEALKLKPGAIPAWNDLGGVLYMMGSYQDSLTAFDKARQLGEETPGNWYFRAIILDKLRQLKPALEAYRHFLSISEGKNPNEEFLARQRARIIQKELEK
ncbi:MAG TPA: tetratricopeptide repeat protein [Bryobacteraceae bacterium]|nr:tetratricopeptide repeat protein [Bryobacteraceae bacterium]